MSPRVPLSQRDVAVRIRERGLAVNKYLKSLTLLTVAIMTFAASPASARVTANGLAVKGTESSGPQRVVGPTLARITGNGRAVSGAEGNNETPTLDSQGLRVIGIELPR